MPEESINNFINNIVVLIIFLAIAIVIFLLIFLISRLMIIRVKKRNAESNITKKLIDYEKAFTREISPIISSHKTIDFKKDPFIHKNILVIGVTFSMLVLSVIIIMLALYIINNLSVGPLLYLLCGLLFIVFSGSVYIIKAKTLD
jgi:hypothetical protein